ncbi:hypothetical protein OK016_09810 [Vibrio chagasii]|nr:hypothetical protein [Vibrio chagasii]
MRLALCEKSCSVAGLAYRTYNCSSSINVEVTILSRMALERWCVSMLSLWLIDSLFRP